MGYGKLFVKMALVAAVICGLWILGDTAPIGADTAGLRITLPGLTKGELQWLSHRQEIRIGTMDAWPPMNFLNTDGEPIGIGADYIRAMNRMLGNRLKIVPGPFKSNLEKVNKGKLDAIMDITPKEERRKFLLFTRVYLDIPHVIVGPRQGPYFRSEDDLAGKSVALESGFYNITYFKKNYPRVKILVYPDTALALDAVVRGEADIYAGNRAVAAYIMEKELMSTLRFHGRLRKPGSVLAIGVPKERPELAAILDKALAAIADSEIKAIHRKWSGMSEVSGSDSLLDPFPEEKRDRRSNIRLNDKGKETVVPHPLMDSRMFGLYGILVLGVVVLVFFVLIKGIRQERVAASFGSSWFRIMVVVGLSIFILVVAGLGWLLIERTRQTVLKDLNYHLSLTLSLIQDRIGMWLEERTALMRQLGRDPQLVNITNRLLRADSQKDTLFASHALADIRNFFQTGQDVFRNTCFFIINPEGITIGAMQDQDTDLGTRNFIADRYPDLVKRAFQGEVGFVTFMFSEGQSSEGDHQGCSSRTMFFISPVQDMDQRVIAVMSLRIDPVRDLARLIRLSGEWSSDDAYAFDHSGRMLTPSRFEDQLREIGLLKAGQNAALTMEVRDPGGDMTHGFRPVLSAGKRPLTRMAVQALGLRQQMEELGMKHGVSAMGIDTMGYRDYRGVRVFGAWLWDLDLDVGLAAEVDVAEAMAGFNRIRMTVFAVLGGTLVLSIFSVLLALVLGDRTRRVLEAARDNLEEKVAERTLALQENQERFAALLESAPDAMVVSDASGRIVLVNSRTEQLLGYKRAELLGASADMLIPETGRKNHSERRRLFLNNDGSRQKRIEGLELTVRSKSGGEIPVEVGLSPIESRSGILVVASIRDITQRKKMENALTEERERLQNILDTSPVGVAFSADDTLLFANPSFLDMFAVRVGDTAPDIYVDSEARDNVFSMLAKGIRVENFETKMYARDDEIRDMLVTYLPVKYRDTFGTLAWMLDITDRKRAEREIKDKLDELTRFMRLAVGRENKMVQLKEEVNELAERLGEIRRYKIVKPDGSASERRT